MKISCAKILTIIILTVITISISQEYVFGFPENWIPWDENKKLVWSDFKGDNPNSPFAAYTTWYVSWNYSWIFSNTEECYYEFSRISANANFEKDKSWIKKGRESDWLLNHEQRHFDIAQVLAKEFNERVQIDLKGEKFPCPSSKKDSATINKKTWNKIQNVFDQEHKKALEMEKDYENDTNHGNNSNKQIEWDKKIQLLLNAEREKFD